MLFWGPYWPNHWQTGMLHKHQHRALLSITAISLHVNNQKNLRHRFWEKKNIWHLSYFSHFPLISAESHFQKKQAKPHFQLIFWMVELIWRKKTRVIFLWKAILGQEWTDGLICFYILTSSKARAQEEIAFWRKKKKKKTAKRKKKTSPHPCLTLPDAKLLYHILNVLNLSQHTKIQENSSTHSWDRADWKMLQSAW